MADRHVLMITVATLFFANAAAAQWLTHPTPGVPRDADGKADLAAAPPRTPHGTPDLSGMWGWQPGRYFPRIAADLKPEEISPAAHELSARRMDEFGKDDPSNLQCLPQGPRMNQSVPIAAKIIQAPTLIVILSEDFTFRQIFLDGRSLPEDPHPSFMGYSVGRWEGDTLVVDTIGFKDRTWLDFTGLPHSESLRITERVRRPTFGRLEIEQTINDPHVFTRPFTVQLGARYIADTELLEYVCLENEKSRARIVGSASEQMKRDVANAVQVPRTILERYVGTYEMRFPENPTVPLTLTIRLEGDTLFIGGGPLVPLSETTFAGGLKVVTDERGFATHLVIPMIEGDIRAPRVADR